jgi:hypothetical protein
MTEPAEERFSVKPDGSSKTWLVWDGLLKRPAVLKGKDLNDLAFSAAEALKDALNADHPSD